MLFIPVFASALLDLEVLEKERMIYFLVLPFGNAIFAAMTSVYNTGNTCTDEGVSPLFWKTVLQTAECG